MSFVTDFDARAITVNTYLSDQNPVLIPIGSDSAAHTANMQSSIATKYGASVTVDADTANTAVGNFDLLFLFPKKTAIPTLKGGVFFTNTTIPSGGNTLYEYYTLVNTKSPTSPFFLENIATETILNQVFTKSVTI